MPNTLSGTPSNVVSNALPTIHGALVPPIQEDPTSVSALPPLPVDNFCTNVEKPPAQDVNESVLHPVLEGKSLHSLQTIISQRPPPLKPSSSTIKERERRRELLPYSMQPLQSKEYRICKLCDPPFEDYSEACLEGQIVCSFECVKRYVQEHLTKPIGLKVKHGKVISDIVNGEVQGGQVFE